jgi:3-deoxy-D-arabino-heptulosonate 7-phosphate (DAHP) synthase
VLIVMKKDATPDQVRGVSRAIAARGFKAHPIPGAQRTAIGVTGNRGAVDRGVRGHPRHPRLQARVARGEVLDPEGVDLVEHYADVIQIGVRNMQNFSLLNGAARRASPCSSIAGWRPRSRSS